MATSNMKLIGASRKFVEHIFTEWPLSAITVLRFSPKSIGVFHSMLSIAVLNMNLDMSIAVAVTRFTIPWRAVATATVT